MLARCHNRGVVALYKTDFPRVVLKNKENQPCNVMQLDLSALQTSADDLDPSFRWGTHVSPRLDPNGSAKAMVPNKELISQITEG